MKFIEVTNGEMLNVAAVRSFKLGTRDKTKTVNTVWGEEEKSDGSESTLEIHTLDGKRYFLLGAQAEAAHQTLSNPA
jgi:hypothetical protein